MREILDTVILDNTIKQYIIAGIVICFVFLVKKYVARYVAGLLFSLLQRRWKTIDKTDFKKLLVKPLGLFLAVLVTLIALDKLTFPSALDVTIYRISLKNLMDMIGVTLLIVTFFVFLIRCIDFIVLVIRERFMRTGDVAEHQLFFFFKDFIKVIVGLLGLMLILKYAFKYPVRELLTGLSIVGAAIALALKESLENLIASFVIFFDKPFSTGDYVKVYNISGTIEKIGLRSTRIRSDAKTYITVPNKQMVDSILDNQSQRTQRRADLRLEISPSTPADKVQQLVAGIKAILATKEIISYKVFATDITPAAIIISCEYYSQPHNLEAHNETKQSVNIEVLRCLKQLGIQLASEETDIKIVKNDNG
ncbi:MAG: mechanosensitive ion channel [Niabella sp.]